MKSHHSRKITFWIWCIFFLNLMFFIYFCNNSCRTPNNKMNQVVRWLVFWTEKIILKFEKVRVQPCVDLNCEEFKYCAELENFSNWTCSSFQYKCVFCIVHTVQFSQIKQKYKNHCKCRFFQNCTNATCNYYMSIPIYGYLP